MYLLGTFATQQFKAGADADDVDFFAFPEVDSAHGLTPSTPRSTAS